MTQEKVQVMGRWAVAAWAMLGACVALRAQAPGAAAGWQATAQLLQGYSSNVLLNPAQPSGDATTSLMVDLGRTWTGPGWSFKMAFMPQGRNYARHRELDYVSEAYHQSWTYAAGPHTMLTWSTDLARFPERAGAPQFGGAGVAGVANASQAMSLNNVMSNGTSNF